MPAGLRVSTYFRVAITVSVIAIASSMVVTQTSSYFTPTDSLSGAHESGTTAEVDGGRVLFAGARDGRAEIYDPQAGRFAPAGVSNVARGGAAAVRLSDGRVLVVGGAGDTGVAAAAAEFYDTASGTFAPAGELTEARVRPAVVKLRDGRVLVAGGHDGAAPLDSAELFDPATGHFVSAGRMSTRRVGVAALLADGTVLVTGAELNTASASAELFDPASGAFRPTGTLNVARRGHAVTPLSDGRALVTGGVDDRGGAVAAAEIYDPVSGRFEFAGALKNARYDHTAVLLGDGAVFVVGGRDHTGPLSSTEVYSSASGMFSVDADMLEARVAPAVVPLRDGGALVAGGNRADGEWLTTAERYWRQDKRQDTSTTLRSSVAASTYGQPVTYTATVTGADGVPAGTVRFLLDGTRLGQAPLVAGRAELTTAATPAGTRVVSAVYDGSSAFKRSESSAIQQVVAKAAAAGSFTISPIQRQYSDPVTFTATISPATAARSVTFKLGTTVIGEAEIVAGKATLVMPVTPTMPPGSRIIAAVFNQEVANYTIANVSKSMSIVREDARVVQYGGTVYTACQSCTTAKVLLRATVRDISATAEANGDASPGDIRNATFTFINRSSYAGIATVPVTVSDLADPRTGEAVYEWTVDLGSAASKSFKIGYSVGGLYTRNTYDYVTLTVVRPKQ